jgi:Cu2+-exporting ATPase
VVFRFADRLRADAGEAVAGCTTSACRPSSSRATARRRWRRGGARPGIGPWQARATPAEKAHRIETLRSRGAKPLMVGDGINDAAALALAHVSVSPASGTDIAQAASDIVLRGEGLSALPLAIRVARKAQALARQNIAFSLAYNLVAVPMAVLGFVTRSLQRW